MDLDTQDVIELIEEHGITVVHMGSVRERVRGVEMTAYTRRIYERELLVNELKWLKRKSKVRTIGLYSVTPIEKRKVKGATIAVPSDGIQLSWAYSAGV